MPEKMFEGSSIESRFVTVLPVIFGLVGTFVPFFIASYDILKVISFTYQCFFTSGVEIDLHEDVVEPIIGAMDSYLMVLVLSIPSFGVYEFPISKIGEFKQARQSKVLEVYSLDQLRDKPAKVVIMVLVVNFFQRVLQMKLATSAGMTYLAESVLALYVKFYFLHKGGYRA